MSDREEFEEWARAKQPWLLEKPTDDAYRLVSITAWSAWKAARATPADHSRELEALRELQRTVEHQIEHGNGTLAIEAAIDRLRALTTPSDER